MNREKNTRVRQIVTHPLYQQEFSALQRAEQGRIYCNHTMEHFLDVARICYILVLQDGADLPRELIYGAALLHDLGRYRQIADGFCCEARESCKWSEEEKNMEIIL